MPQGQSVVEKHSGRCAENGSNIVLRLYEKTDVGFRKITKIIRASQTLCVVTGHHKVSFNAIGIHTGAFNTIIIDKPTLPIF
jgi:hypothetical protein